MVTYNTSSGLSTTSYVVPGVRFPLSAFFLFFFHGRQDYDIIARRLLLRSIRFGFNRYTFEARIIDTKAKAVRSIYSIHLYAKKKNKLLHHSIEQ